MECVGGDVVEQRLLGRDQCLAERMEFNEAPVLPDLLPLADAISAVARDLVTDYLAGQHEKGAATNMPQRSDPVIESFLESGSRSEFRFRNTLGHRLVPQRRGRCTAKVVRQWQGRASKHGAKPLLDFLRFLFK